MPEGLEAEIWREAMTTLVGRTITSVWLDERVGPGELPGLVAGAVIEHIGRHGKVVVVHTDGPAIGLHFGMTGRVIVDGVAPIERLEYSSGADRPEWDRLRMSTGAAVPALRLNDPRRLGRVSLDPDLGHLGVDFLTVDTAGLRRAFAGRRLAVKQALLEQGIVAGLGNLCADEVLWWAGLAPTRTVDGLSAAEVRTLAGTIRRRMPIMLRRGGSTTGTIDPALRRALGPCPRDGAALRRGTLGGRTAVWCPAHQR